MTLDEAIERLSRESFLIWKSEWEKDREAMQIGIEGLKRWKERHDRCPDDINFLLPGETEN